VYVICVPFDVTAIPPAVTVVGDTTTGVLEPFNPVNVIVDDVLNLVPVSVKVTGCPIVIDVGDSAVRVGPFDTTWTV